MPEKLFFEYDNGKQRFSIYRLGNSYTILSPLIEGKLLLTEKAVELAMKNPEKMLKVLKNGEYDSYL